eukprot:6475428-Lingulodinium_polyedra.AAC.1
MLCTLVADHCRARASLPKIATTVAADRPILAMLTNPACCHNQCSEVRVDVFAQCVAWVCCASVRAYAMQVVHIT